MLDMISALLLKNQLRGERMRERWLVVIFCAFFILFGTAGYSDASPKAKSGAGLHKAARKHHTAHTAKKKHAGKKKVIRTPIEVVEDEQDPEFMEYRVQKGDTVEKLAAKFDVDKQDIIDLNALRKMALTPGTKLVIPKETNEDASAEDPIVLNTVKPLKRWKNEEERGVLVKVARSFSGAPYKYGGDSVRGLDCSAFVRKMYEIFDVQLPRTAREQFQAGVRIEKGELATGDLVFFRTRRAVKEPTHVGIYIGEGKFIHASSVLKRGVKVDSLNEGYFDRTYTGAVRVKTLDKDRSS